MSPMTWSMFDYMFPLFAGVKESSPDVVLGTAFHIGGGLFMTAGHSLRNASDYPHVGLGKTDGESWRWNALSTDTFEIVSDHDLGFFQVDRMGSLPSLSWCDRRLPMSSQVRSAGYAHSLDLERRHCNGRVFSGYVVSDPRVDVVAARPVGYELSFQCPRGLSGAPVLVDTSADTLPEIGGVVIGNQSMKMLVFSSAESIVEGGERTTVEQYEALQLGIAVSSIAVCDLRSRRAGGTVRAHLASHELV